MKHATISFGQSLEPAVLSAAQTWMEQADLVIAMGSSLVVHPAAGLPQFAVERGARLVIINRDETPLDGLADLVLHGDLGETLTRVDELL